MVSSDIEHQVAKAYGAMRQVPAVATPNLRNDMYLSGDAVRLLTKSKRPPNSRPHLEKAKTLKAFQGRPARRAPGSFPTWVKISVAIALGLGTMVGWKRIVVTVGEKIGKEHLTYAQGASAELIAAITIGAAELYGLPVSTTHILSSGVAGTMAANGSGLQWSTVRSIAMAWVMTLPAAIALAGGLYFILRYLI